MIKKYSLMPSIILLGLLLNSWSLQGKELNIVVSLLPFASLVDHVAYPNKSNLLIAPGQSPHHFSLKPSGAKLLAEADLIIYGAKQLETFLVPSLKNSKSANLALADAPNLMLLPSRHAGLFADGDCCHHHEFDPHFWLNPHNAIYMAKAICQSLSLIDPARKADYQHNTKLLEQKLRKLDEKLRTQLAPYNNKGFLVFHDAYQYFEKRYHLSALGALALHPEIPLSLKTINKIKKLQSEQTLYAIFAEPQFQAKVVKQLAKDLNLSMGYLDPLGASQSPFEAYFVMMHNLAQSFSQNLH